MSRPASIAGEARSEGSAPAQTAKSGVTRLQQALSRSSRLLRETATGGLTPTQLAVLGVLLRDGPKQLTELASIERINPTLLSRVVGRLEDAGYVKRSPQEQDRRAYVVSITDQGQSLAEGIRRDRSAALGDRLARLDPIHVATLMEALPALEALADELTATRKN